MKEYFEKLYTEGQKSFEKSLEYRLTNNIKTFVVTANPETLMIGQEKSDFDALLKNPQTTIVPDGIGVVKAGRILGMKVKGRVTGVELSQYLIESANQLEKSIYFYGAKQEVVETLIEKVKREYPRVEIAGYSNGYEGEKDQVFQRIIAAKPDIVLVALGIPQQELLIERYYDQFEKGIFVGVGGSFDVLSGMKKRAPQIFIKCNLEWLYRIIKEPKRIERFYRSNIRFIKMIKNMH